MTHYCCKKVDIGRGRHVWMDGNTKVQLGDVIVPNSFSLVSVKDCPGSTATCRKECYTGGVPDSLLEKYEHNSQTIRHVLQSGIPQLQAAAVLAFAAHMWEHCPSGFRWHVSGDLYSSEYTNFVAMVARTASDVPMWIYTRSFEWIGQLRGIPNLTVNISADWDNREVARRMHHLYGFRVCFMSDASLWPPLPANSVVMPVHRYRRGTRLGDNMWSNYPEAEFRRMICPPDMFGQSEHLRCGPCRKCIDQPANLVPLRVGAVK